MLAARLAHPVVTRLRLGVALSLLVAATAMNLVIQTQSVLRGAVAQDYRYQWAAGRIGLVSGWSRIYSTTLQRQEWHHFWNDAFKPFINPPPVAWLTAPLSLLPWPTARILWTVGAAAAVLATVLLAAPRSGRARLLYVLLAVAFTPVVGSIRDGQVVLLVATAIVVGVRLVQTRHEVLAGLALSFICVKPHLAVMVPIALALTGHWRTLATLMIAGAAWLGASLLSVGLSGVHDYMALLRWAATFETQRQRSPMWFAGSGPWPAVIEMALSLGVVAAMIALRRRRLPVVLSVAIVGSLLVSPYSNFDDLSLLLLPLWLLYQGRWTPLSLAAAALVVGVELLELLPRAVPVIEVITLAAFVIMGARARWASRPLHTEFA